METERRQNSTCKGPGVRLCLLYWKSSEETTVAGAEWVSGREREARSEMLAGARSQSTLWQSGFYSENARESIRGLVCKGGTS